MGESDQGGIWRNHAEWNLGSGSTSKGTKDRVIKVGRRFDAQREKVSECNPDTTPIATGIRLYKSTPDDDNLMDDPKEYQSIVGSQTSNSPNESHYAITKRVSRYLKGTLHIGITFSGSLGLCLELYCDADWADGEDRKSISAHTAKLAGGAVSWRAKKQATGAMSSEGAGYMALLQATKESLWIQRLLDKLGRTAENPNIIYTDNQGAIALAHNPEHHARTKHVDIQYHFVRNCVEDGTTRLEYCPTEDMVADGLTKALGPERLRKLARMMGMGVWQKSDEKEKEGEAATDEEITRMRSGSDERTSSPVMWRQSIM